MIWTELGSKFSSPVALTEPQHHLGGGVGEWHLQE